MGLYQHALDALQTADFTAKTSATFTMSENWRHHRDVGQPVCSVPHTPSRPSKPELVPPGDVPRRRIGSIEGRAALLHAVAHIEFNAIDLALDMICRFGSDERIPDECRLEFMDDWVSVANDEAIHFGLVNSRLEDLGYEYGNFPAHNGLWEAAQSTSHNLAARLAVAPMVLEARGLDVTPDMIKKFKRVGDEKSARILQRIYTDEVNHVRIGTKWFHEVAKTMNRPPESYFKALVKAHFKGQLKPPFNHEARGKAGVPQSYYSS